MTTRITVHGRAWLVSRAPNYQCAFGTWHRALSRALVCPACADLWALFREETEPVYAVHATCMFCIDRAPALGLAPVPGSILIDEGYGRIDIALLNSLPDELLQREFHLHLDFYRRNRKNEA